GRAASAEVDREHEVGAELLDPGRELVKSDFVGLGRVPREITSHGSRLTGTHAVLPLETRDEVATRVADAVEVQLLRDSEHVTAEPLLVRGRVVGLVDPAVDRAADVLDERSEQPTADGRDREGGVEGEAGA